MASRCLPTPRYVPRRGLGPDRLPLVHTPGFRSHTPPERRYGTFHGARTLMPPLLPQVKLRLEPCDDDGGAEAVRVTVDAPYYADPAPAHEPGICPGLWDYEVRPSTP
jgi:hypothetical protein